MRSYDNLRKILSVSCLIMCTFHSVNLAAANAVVLDNSKSGTSSIGTWKLSGGASPYGSNSLYSKVNGDSYAYKFNLAVPGQYQVFARWTEWPSRRTSVPYNITHLGGTSVVKVNQQLKGGQWNQLGNTWSFGSTAIITIRSLGNGSTNADAIKLVPVGGNSVPVVAVGNQNANAGDTLRFNVSATDSDGASPVLSAEGLPRNAVFIDNNNGTGVFTWPTTQSDTGSHNVTFVATDTSDPTVTGRKTVCISVVDGSGPVTLDNGKLGTSSVGTWKVSGGASPYGSNSLYSKVSGDSYTYKFNLPAPGEYQVFARWTEWPSRRTSVPYNITHLGGTSVVKVNQQLKGGQWNQLGNTWSFGLTAIITIGSLGNGSTNADAIKLVPVGGNSVPVEGDCGTATMAVFEHDFDDEALKSYTRDDLMTTWNSSGNVQAGAVKIVQDPDPSGSHGKVMQVFHAANSIHTRNGGASWRTKIASYDELYFSYDVYFEDDAEFIRGGKLPGLGIRNYYSAAGVPPDGTDRWTGGIMWNLDGKLTSYIYHANQPGQYGQQFEWQGSYGQLSLQKGKWNRIEIYYKMNTPGVLDGRLKGWFNGKLALDTNRVMYRMPGGEHLTIGGIAVSNYYGGGDLSWAPTTDQHIYFDNFVVSTNPITH